MVSIKNSTYHRGPHIKVNSPRTYTFSGRAAAGTFGGRDGDVPVREGSGFFDAPSRIVKSRSNVQKEQTFTGTNALSPHIHCASRSRRKGARQWRALLPHGMARLPRTRAAQLYVTLSSF
jgi:hypothetical protein